MTNFLFPDSSHGSFSVSHQDWSLHRKGPADQQRHKEKIKEAIKKNLGQIVSEESIILSDGKKLMQRADPLAGRISLPLRLHERAARRLG